QLFVTMPEHVILLRGNHEDFVEVDGRITSRVFPADSLFTLAAHAPPEALDAYRVLFEAMPTSFVFDRTLFVHGGIPRDETTAGGTARGGGGHSVEPQRPARPLRDDVGRPDQRRPRPRRAAAPDGAVLVRPPPAPAVPRPRRLPHDDPRARAVRQRVPGPRRH